MNWRNGLKIKTEQKKSLHNYTTFKIGGRPKYFFEPKDINELKLLVSLSKKYKTPILVLGAGSNILASDKGVDALVVRLNSPSFKWMKFENTFIKIGSGIMLNRVVSAAKRRGLSGAEFLAGIPGTVGGALVMNAGVSEKVKGKRPKARGIGDIVQAATVMDGDGGIKTLHKNEMKFGYRRSNLSEYIILSACIKLLKKNGLTIVNKINKYLDYRRISQDSSYPSAGCIFKNPVGFSAGQLIDLCGLKGRQIGGACISRKHANFILNTAGAKARDVFALMDLMQKEVKNKFNITLEPEIKIWR